MTAEKPISFSKTTSILGARFLDGGREEHVLFDFRGQNEAYYHLDDHFLPCEAWPPKDLTSEMRGPRGHFEITVVFIPETPLPPEREADEPWPYTGP